MSSQLVFSEMLKNYALSQVGAAYVYGATGQPCTPSYRRARMAQYPKFAKQIRGNCRVLSGQAERCDGCRYAGRLAFDCAQLVKKALAQAGIFLPSGASSQWKARGLWAQQGQVHPDVLLGPCVLFRASSLRNPGDRPMVHVGLCLGEGLVVDARSHREGVVQGPATRYPWTHFALPPGSPLVLQAEKQGERPQIRSSALAYHQESSFPAPLYQGLWGPRVKALQQALLALGFALPRHGADGYFGPETAGALIAFQHQQGLIPDGVARRDSLQKIYEPEHGGEERT